MGKIFDETRFRLSDQPELVCSLVWECWRMLRESNILETKIRDCLCQRQLTAMRHAAFLHVCICASMVVCG